MKDKSWFPVWWPFGLTAITFICMGMFIAYGVSDAKKEKEFACLSFTNYCLEVHVLEPTHEDYMRFLEQEKQFPNYYQKHIIDAQKEHDLKYKN